MGRAFVRDFHTRAKIPYARPAHEVISIYSPPGAVNIALYSKIANQSDCSNHQVCILKGIIIYRLFLRVMNTCI